MQEGVEFFNQSKFWEAHESWEQEWKTAQDATRAHLQGMIQAVGVFVLLKKARPDAAKRLALRARYWLKLGVDSQIKIQVNPSGALDALLEEVSKFSTPLPDQINSWLKRAEALKAELGCRT